jgi:LacI family sucrose operon transcriptional repressor
MTINEIAQMAGVSRATVSRYLNEGYVSEEKRVRIARVIEQTGYVPSNSARMLRTGKTRFVGVIIPKINSGSIGREVAGISSVLAASGYRAVYANTDNDEELELTYLHSFREYGSVDGLILIGTVITEKHRKMLSDVSTPVVVLGQRVPGMSCVYFDDYNSIYDLTLCCIQGRAHPAYIGVSLRDVAAGQMREQAFLDAAKASGLPEGDAIVERGTFTVASGCSHAEKIVAEHPEVDAIVCATDAIAAGAMDVLRTSGRRVPEDVRLTGLGDSSMSSILWPHLTTVHFPYRTAGTEAARLLVEAMEQDKPAVREVKMGYRLVLRDTTPELE